MPLQQCPGEGMCLVVFGVTTDGLHVCRSHAGSPRCARHNSSVKVSWLGTKGQED